jgi:hypothetical protein
MLQTEMTVKTIFYFANYLHAVNPFWEGDYNSDSQ